MTYLVERLAELKRHLDHLRQIRPRVHGNLSKNGRFDPALVREPERLPGFRNVLIHEYVALDMDRVIEALDGLGPVERFLEVVRIIEAE